MKKTIAVLLAIVIVAILILPNISNAQPGDTIVKISADSTIVEVGDTFKVTVSQYQPGGTEAKSTKYVGFKLKYDKNIFSYEGIEGDFQATDDNAGTITVTMAAPHGVEDISSVSLKFKATKATDGNGVYFGVSEFKSGESSENAQVGQYTVMQVRVQAREKYEGKVSIQANKESVPVERKVNISLAQTDPTNYVEATISYDNAHFEFVGPADSNYQADSSTEGKVTVKASGTDITDVTLLFKATAETQENSPSWFKIENYKSGNSEEEATNAHLYYSKEVSVAVTARDRSTVQIRTDLTDDTAKVGDTFTVTVSQDKPTDYVQFDLFYDKEIFGYVDLGDNQAQVTASQEDDLLTVSASGSQISEINLQFKALGVTEGRNSTDEEYIKVSNFLAGDNSGDTDSALYNIQQVGIKVVEAPVEEPEPELPIDELPATGSAITTTIAAIVATILSIIVIAAIILKKYINK